jgi:LysR family transcriptional regulator, regulator for bpeEF and oprC
MDKLRALEYFVASAEEGSFAGAGRRLDVSVPSVHKLINSLEHSLGVRLFERTAKGLSLTASGQSYLEACQPLLAELAAVDEVVNRSTQRPAGVVVLGAHPQLAKHVLLPALPAFHARYPEIQIDLRVVNRTSDVDTGIVDVFLLHGWPDDPDFVHRRLGHTATRVVASPNYWRRYGIPADPTELARHTCMLMRNPNGTLIDLWEFARGDDKLAVTVNGWLSSNGREVILDAVLAGEGVGRFTEVTTRAHLQSGLLVPVLGDWQVVGGPPVNLLYRPAQRRSPRVRLMIDFLVGLFDDGDSDCAAGEHSERPQWHRSGRSRASTAQRQLR